MRYSGDHHVLPLFGLWRCTLHERKILLNKKQNARSFYLCHTSKLYQQKQWDVVSKSTAKIYPSNKYNIFPSFNINQSWNTFQLKNIVLSFHQPFEPITARFTTTGLWPEENFQIPASRSLVLSSVSFVQDTIYIYYVSCFSAFSGLLNPQTLILSEKRHNSHVEQIILNYWVFNSQ